MEHALHFRKVKVGSLLYQNLTLQSIFERQLMLKPMDSRSETELRKLKGDESKLTERLQLAMACEKAANPGQIFREDGELKVIEGRVEDAAKMARQIGTPEEMEELGRYKDVFTDTVYHAGSEGK